MSHRSTEGRLGVIKRVFLEEVASNIRPPSMEELAGRSIQARGRALWRQKKLWFVPQMVGSSGKLEHRDGGEARWERRQRMSKAPVVLPLWSCCRVLVLWRTSHATLTPAWNNWEVLRKGEKMIRFQMMGEMTAIMVTWDRPLKQKLLIQTGHLLHLWMHPSQHAYPGPNRADSSVSSSSSSSSSF